jgi:hypothetical protein
MFSLDHGVETKKAKPHQIIDATWHWVIFIDFIALNKE